MLDRRRLKRIVMGFRTEITYGDKNCVGTIVSFSEEGLGVYVEYSSTANVIDFVPATKIKLEFQPSPEQILHLHCEIQWSQTQDNPYAVTTNIGMEIIDPTQGYKEFFKTLDSDTVE